MMPDRSRHHQRDQLSDMSSLHAGQHPYARAVAHHGKGQSCEWLKKEGDKVKPGDVIAEIETDKATMEYEAIDEGTLAKIVVPEGTQDVPVNQLIAVLAEEGEDVKAAAAGAGKGTAAIAKSAATAYTHQAQRHRPHPRRSGRRELLRRATRARSTGARPGGGASVGLGAEAANGLTATAYSLRRWRAGWPRMPASTSGGSQAPARTAASSRAMSKPPNRARSCRPGRRLAPAAAPLAVQAARRRQDPRPVRAGLV